MANISSDKHDGTGYMVLGTPKNIIASHANNSIIQLTSFEFSYVFTFLRRFLMSLQ